MLQVILTTVLNVQTDVKGLQTGMKEVRSDVKGLQTEMKEVKSDVKGLQTEMKEVKSDVKGLQTEMKEVKSDVKGLQTEMKEVKSDVKGLQTEMKEVKADIQVMKSDIQDLKSSVQAIQLTLDNEVIHGIRIIAEAHVDLHRKLHEALKITNEEELIAVRVTHLEKEVREINEWIDKHRPKRQHGIRQTYKLSNGVSHNEKPNKSEVPL